MSQSTSRTVDITPISRSRAAAAEEISAAQKEVMYDEIGQRVGPFETTGTTIRYNRLSVLEASIEYPGSSCQDAWVGRERRTLRRTTMKDRPDDATRIHD